MPEHCWGPGQARGGGIAEEFARSLNQGFRV